MKKIKHLLFIAVLLCITASTNAQSINATNASTSIGASGLTSRSSGCDIYRYNSDLFRVFVNEVDHKLYWSNIIGGTPTSGSTGFTHSSVSDPDVTLVEYGNKIYAVVVYDNTGSGTQGFYYQEFVWNAGSFVGSTAINLLSGNYGSDAINIDGDDYGNWVIVYEASGHIYVATGTVVSSLTNNFRLVNNSHYKWPDIALYNDGTTNLATISYVDGTDILNVEQHTFSNLSAGIYSPTYTGAFNGTGGSFVFSFQPRVAVPFAAGYSTDWTVVAAEDDNTNFNIIGWNTYAGSVGSAINYASMTSITNSPNYLPCVAYDNSYPGGSFPIWVGWTFSNINTALLGFDKADFVTAVPCGSNGSPIGTGIYEIESSQTLGDISEALSLAGCSSGNSDLLLYWDNYTVGGSATGQYAYLDLLAPNCSTSFRISKNELNSLSPFASVVTVSVYSTIGALISEKNIEYAQVDQYILWLKNNLHEPSIICVLKDNFGNRQTIKTNIIH